jgi:hypothetical protein
MNSLQSAPLSQLLPKLFAAAETADQGAKGLYSSILDLIEPHLREGALVVADNADMAPKFLERIRSPALYVSLPSPTMSR